MPLSRAERQIQARLAQVLADQKLVLFGVSTEASKAARARIAAVQHERYGAAGLRHVPVDDMPAAIEALFSSLDLRRGERLLEIGPGPHGGVALVAALMGLHVVVVEYDQPFPVDVDRLRDQLGAAGSATGVAALAAVRGLVMVRPTDSLTRVVDPYRRLVAAAKGSFTIVPGDFADERLQRQVLARGTFDHVICTDVISPMGSALSDTTAMLTTGDPQRGESILRGVAEAAMAARTLYTGFLLPEQAPTCRERIAGAYDILEGALRARGRVLRFADVFSPSSGTVCRSRLYHLGEDVRAAAS